MLTLAFILSTALTPASAPGPFYILLFALILSVEVLSELGVAYVLKRAALAFPFVLAALPVIFTTPGGTLFTLSLGPWTLTASLPGLEHFLSIAFKSWVSVQAAIVLAATTPFPDLLVAMRAVRIPRLLVAIFGLMWRYLFVLVDEVLRLLRALAARSGVSADGTLKTGGSLLWRAHVAGGMAGSLFLRAPWSAATASTWQWSRAVTMVRSALCPLPGLKPYHWVILSCGIGALAILVMIAYLLWS